MTDEEDDTPRGIDDEKYAELIGKLHPDFVPKGTLHDPMEDLLEGWDYDITDEWFEFKPKDETYFYRKPVADEIPINVWVTIEAYVQANRGLSAGYILTHNLLPKKQHKALTTLPVNRFQEFIEGWLEGSGITLW